MYVHNKAILYLSFLYTMLRKHSHSQKFHGKGHNPFLECQISKYFRQQENLIGEEIYLEIMNLPNSKERLPQGIHGKTKQDNRILIYEGQMGNFLILIKDFHKI